MENEQIERTLNHGSILIGKKLCALYVFVVFSIFIVLAALAVTVMVIVLTANNMMEMSYEILFGLVGSNIFVCMVAVVVVFRFIKNRNLTRQINLWKQDAVKTVAVINRIDNVRVDAKPYQVQATFEVDGVKYRRISNSGSAIKGYDTFLSRYDGKKIPIYYSKKYDEVLIGRLVENDRL